jgi:hypothetical protein
VCSSDLDLLKINFDLNGFPALAKADNIATSIKTVAVASTSPLESLPTEPTVAVVKTTEQQH